MEGMDVYLNPRALHPLDEDLLPGAPHHHLYASGIVESHIPDGQTLASASQIVSTRKDAGASGSAREAG